MMWVTLRVLKWMQGAISEKWKLNIPNSPSNSKSFIVILPQSIPRFAKLETSSPSGSESWFWKVKEGGCVGLSRPWGMWMSGVFVKKYGRIGGSVDPWLLVVLSALLFAPLSMHEDGGKCLNWNPTAYCRSSSFFLVRMWLWKVWRMEYAWGSCAKVTRTGSLEDTNCVKRKKIVMLETLNRHLVIMNSDTYCL